MLSEQELYDQLAFYTLSRPDPTFIHQYIVDAFRLQTADENTKPIGMAFALISLYLYVEKGYTGRQAQLAHMQMAKRRRLWPKFILPKDRGNVRVADVLAAEPGRRRDEMIRVWCASVWSSYEHVHHEVTELAHRELRIPD